jgi:hypothetical protein
MNKISLSVPNWLLPIEFASVKNNTKLLFTICLSPSYEIPRHGHVSFNYRNIWKPIFIHKNIRRNTEPSLWFYFYLFMRLLQELVLLPLVLHFLHHLKDRLSFFFKLKLLPFWFRVWSLKTIKEIVSLKSYSSSFQFKIIIWFEVFYNKSLLTIINYYNQKYHFIKIIIIF